MTIKSSFQTWWSAGPMYTGDFEETYKLVTAGCRDWLQWIKDRQ